FRVFFFVRAELAIEGGEEIQFASLLALAHAFWRREIENGSVTRTERSALETRREKAGTPIFGTTDRFSGVGHHHECRKILVGGAKPICSPCAERRAAGENVAGIHLADGSDVIQTVRPAGAKNGDVVDMLGDIWKPIRNPDTAFAVLFEFA